MSKTMPEIDDDLAAWISKQHLFFVATAPLTLAGHINCSPKGGDSFRVLGPMDAAYQDYTGSGAETIAHLGENGRIVIMFCALEGQPQVVRLHGQGRVILPGDEDYNTLSSRFPPNLGERCLIHVRISRVSSSCGYAVPIFDFCRDRDALDKWAAAKGPERLKEYRAEHNAVSVDGLPALSPTPEQQ